MTKGHPDATKETRKALSFRVTKRLVRDISTEEETDRINHRHLLIKRGSYNVDVTQDPSEAGTNTLVEPLDGFKSTSEVCRNTALGWQLKELVLSSASSTSIHLGTPVKDDVEDLDEILRDIVALFVTGFTMLAFAHNVFFGEVRGRERPVSSDLNVILLGL